MLGGIYGLLGGSRQQLYGVGYGLGCWLANYGVLLPLARIYPSLDDDHALRAASNALSHVVFGWTLAAAWPRSSRQRFSRPFQ